MLSNIPFNVKDWAMWVLLWLAVGFFTALQAGNAFACVYMDGSFGPPQIPGLCDGPTHSQQYQQFRDESGISQRHYYQDNRGFTRGCLTRRFGSTYTTSCN
jgi:hypothetical protein